MALTAGARVGPYEVIALLDGGGQGDIYRARDTRLPREVALKVLPDDRIDERRRARFEREAQALAALNHPNIATLIGVEDAQGVLALVMELVDGESLAGRLAAADSRGLSTHEALRIGRQIAHALEAAHERGIVHRDLKPANVMIRADGTVKLLDFGLAKRLTDEGAGATASTLTGRDGTVVGTAAYMSPQQARGLDIDRRTDVWAFGCVLYEMLTGRRAFDGTTASDAIVSVLTREPDLDALPADVPGAVRRLLRRCLEKDDRYRLRDMGDVGLEIDDALTAPRGRDASGPSSRVTTARVVWPRYLAIVGFAAIASVAAWFVMQPREGAQRQVSRLSIVFPASAPFAIGRFGHRIAISPDGARIVYGSSRGFAVRARDRLDVAVLQDLGTFPAVPFFSPDGMWIGYVDGPELKRVPIAGGTASRIAEVGHGATASWGIGGIVFADIRGVFLVSADGGQPQKLETAELGPGEQPAYPQALPGGRGIVFTVVPGRANYLTAASMPGARIEVFDLRTGQQRTLLRGGSHARYVPTGHLVYAAGQGLVAVPFDADALAIRGEPVPLEAAGITEFAVSDEGTLVFSSGAQPMATLVWVDRSGREEDLGVPARNYVYPRLSPEGDRVALVYRDHETRDIAIWDLRRRTLLRFTPDPTDNALVAWSPDGAHLAFSSDRFGASNMFWQAADGNGAAEHLLTSERIQQPLAFARDGRLLFSADVRGRGRDIHALTLATRRVEPIVDTPANELNAEVSPDGGWIAYDSNESGQFEVYVRPYPNSHGGRRWQMSAGGGRQPLWSRDGRQLFYRDFAGAVLGVPVTLTPTFAPGAVTGLLDGAGYVGGGSVGSGRTYDVGRDGRFLMIKEQTRGNGDGPSLVIVQNWFEELTRLAPVR